MLDIHTNPKNPVIGDRALAERAEDVARLGRVIIRALQGAGLAACGKHFPGHGDTSTDSHFELPLVEHPPDRLRAIEFEPFRAAIAEQVAFIMTAHVLVPSLDETRPATLSPEIVQKLLRDELRFDGVILSDDLEMKAVSAKYDVPEAAVDAIRAGCDGVLVCSGDVDLQGRTLEALVRAVEVGQHSRQAARRCVRAAEAGQAALPARRPAGTRRAHQARCAACSAAKSISWSPPRWRRICDPPSPPAIRRSRGARRAGQLVSAWRRSQAGVAELARLGFEAVYDESMFDKDRFVAGSVETRVRAILDAWADPSIAALIAIRGGYGSAQLLPLLDPDVLRSARKALIGYSDITAILTLYQRHGLTAIHGPMIDRRISKGPSAYDEDSFRRVMMSASRPASCGRRSSRRCTTERRPGRCRAAR